MAMRFSFFRLQSASSQGRLQLQFPARYSNVTGTVTKGFGSVNVMRFMDWPHKFYLGASFGYQRSPAGRMSGGQAKRKFETGRSR